MLNRALGRVDRARIGRRGTGRFGSWWLIGGGVRDRDNLIERRIRVACKTNRRDPFSKGFRKPAMHGALIHGFAQLYRDPRLGSMTWASNQIAIFGK